LNNLNLTPSLFFDDEYLNYSFKKIVMPSIESIIFKEPIKKKFLILYFDEDDDVYYNIKQAMLENSLKKISVESCDGLLKNGVINCFSKNCFKKIEFLEKEISKVSGEFKLSCELFGNLKICTKERKPLQGTLVKGITKEGFYLKLSFFE
jgi:predicted DNA-binding protein with PD1-like motif